jgi:hypothetical protein
MRPAATLLAAGIALGATAGCGSRLDNAAREAADTVFAEDFESGGLAAWQDGVDPNRHHIVTDSLEAQSGRRFLRVTYQGGGDGGWLTHFLLPGYDSIYVSLYVRFPAEWRGGTKLVALYGSRTDDQWSAMGKAGLCPTGSDFFATMLIAEVSGDPGPTRFYSYYPAMSREPDGVTCWGRYGDGTEQYAPPLTLSRGEWHHLTFWVKLNEPERENALQQFWIDDTLRGTWRGLRFRNSAALRLNSVQLTFNRGIAGGPTAETLDVDHLVITTAPPAAHN